MTKIPSVEDRVGGIVIDNSPRGRLISLLGALGCHAAKPWVDEALTAERTALLTELRESIQAIDFYGWNEQTQSKIKEKVQAHIDELIKSNSV